MSVNDGNAQSPRVLIVILNYFTYELTLKLVQELKSLEYDNFEVMVVDNSSPNASAEKLRLAQPEHGYIFYANDLNAGYAAGNNIGIRYAVEHGFEYSLIMNNDVEIPEKDFLKKLVLAAQKDPKIAWVGPRIEDNSGETVGPYLKRPSFHSMTWGIAKYNRQRKQYNKTSGEVYRLFGCCMLLDNQAMASVDYMDERTFLYFEEDILAERFRKIGKVAYYLADTSVRHIGSASVKKSQKKRRSTNKIILSSMAVYLKEYRNFSWIEVAFLKLFRNTLMWIRG